VDVFIKGKKGFYTSHLPKNEEIGGIFGSELFSKIQKFKQIAVSVLSLAFPMAPLSGQSNLAFNVCKN
jgi:hypothetical protein